MKKINLALFTLTAAAALSGCNTLSFSSSSSRVVLPSTPPLSADILEQTAASCQKEVERLNSRSPYVPQERKKEYETVMGLAKKNCEEMVETLKRLKAATHQEQSFRQNIQHAESTMLPGTVVTEASNKDKAPQQVGGEISAEPLR